MTYVSRGTHGSFAPGRGDLCGQRFQRNLAKRGELRPIIEQTVDAIRTEPIEIVKVNGKPYAVPRSVYRFLTEGEQR